MAKLEKEIKILNIDINDAYKRLENIGAKFINVKNQKIYTFDLPTIYYRYLEIKEFLNSDNELIINNSISKLKVLLDELTDLISDEKLNKIYKEMNINNFSELYKIDKVTLLNKLQSTELNKEIKNKLINPNKWIRLRKNNDNVELTVKHVYEKNTSSIQKVLEYEITVTDFEETNKLLNSIGLIRRNYQEKIRHSFKYKSAFIEIDEWPLLNPYIEIECDDKEIIKEIIEKLKYEDKEIVSINTEQLYKKQNIDVLKISDLKFDKD